MDFKEIESTFTWSNSKYTENNCREEIINGRVYLKIGKLQSVTFGGVLYKIDSPSDKQINKKYLLLVGVARQNPKDIHYSKTEGEEVAVTNAFTNPIMKLTLPSSISNKDFNKIVKTIYEASYNDTLKLVNTKEELALYGA